MSVKHFRQNIYRRFSFFCPVWTRLWISKIFANILLFPWNPVVELLSEAISGGVCRNICYRMGQFCPFTGKIAARETGQHVGRSMIHNAILHIHVLNQFQPISLVSVANLGFFFPIHWFFWCIWRHIPKSCKFEATFGHVDDPLCRFLYPTQKKKI